MKIQKENRKMKGEMSNMFLKRERVLLNFVDPNFTKTEPLQKQNESNVRNMVR